MSAGNFISSRYEDDGGRVYRARIQPETLALQLNGATNTAPTGAVDQPVSANMTGSFRRNGCNARRVRVRFTGAPPTGYSADDILTIPVLRPAAFNTMTAVQGATGSYLGADIELVGYSSERRR